MARPSLICWIWLFFMSSELRQSGHSVNEKVLAALGGVADFVVRDVHPGQGRGGVVADGDDALEGEEPEQAGDEALADGELRGRRGAVGVGVAGVEGMEGKGVPEEGQGPD